MLLNYPDVYGIIFEQMDRKTVIAAAASVSKLFYSLFRQIFGAEFYIHAVKIWDADNRKTSMNILLQVKNILSMNCMSNMIIEEIDVYVLLISTIRLTPV